MVQTVDAGGSFFLLRSVVTAALPYFCGGRRSLCVEWFLFRAGRTEVFHTAVCRFKYFFIKKNITIITQNGMKEG